MEHTYIKFIFKKHQDFFFFCLNFKVISSKFVLPNTQKYKNEDKNQIKKFML